MMMRMNVSSVSTCRASRTAQRSPVVSVRRVVVMRVADNTERVSQQEADIPNPNQTSGQTKPGSSEQLESGKQSAKSASANYDERMDAKDKIDSDAKSQTRGSEAPAVPASSPSSSASGEKSAFQNVPSAGTGGAAPSSDNIASPGNDSTLGNIKSI